jgi:hypothetical protein
VGSIPVESEGFLKAIKSEARHPSEGNYTRRPQVVRFYGMLKTPLKYERDTSKAKLIIFFAVST